jgi:hypothetical protein
MGLLCLLFSIQFKLAMFCVVVAPLVLYPIVRFSKSMRKTSHRTQERTADLANLVSESCRGHRVVKAFGMEAFEEARFRDATRRHLRANLRGQMLSNLSGPVIESLGVIGAGVFLVFAGRAIHSQTMEPGVLVKFLIGLYAMYDPIRKLNKVNLVVQQSMAAAQRIRSLMMLPVEIEDRPGAASPCPISRSEIRFENVSFRYEEKEVLSGVDLTVRRGEAVALRRPFGGGKTTLCNLVARFFDVTGGRITIDGRDVRDLELASLRGMIGLVTQETVLFNETVRANIAYGRIDLPLERGARGGERRLRRRVHPGDAAGLRHDHRRGWRPPLGRAAAAARHRPRAAQECADPDPRRGDLDARHRVRVAGSEGARQPDARPHDLRHRPPLDHHHHGRPDLRPRGRADRRAGEPCGAAGRRRALPPALRAPVPGVK